MSVGDVETVREMSVRRDESGRVDVSENTNVLRRSVFRDGCDVFLVRRDVEKVRIDVKVTFLGIYVTISREAEDK